MESVGQIRVLVDFKFEHHVIDVAPVPVFTRLMRFDDSVTVGVIVLRCMGILRIVAAANLPANHA